MNPETATPVELPALNAELWDHQKAAFKRAVYRRGFLLAHDMGTGKTATAVALLEDDQAKRVLILCPKNVVGVWPAQLNGPLDPPGPQDGFSPRSWEVWSGRVMGARGPKKNPSVDERAAALIRANTDAIKLGRPFAAVVNYEASWQGEMKALLLGTEWDAIICDESHRLKKPSGKASKHAAAIAERVRNRGGRALCLTGTPMPHTPLDIWAQMRVVDGGKRLFTSFRQFCTHYGEAETIYIPGGKQRSVYKDVRPDRKAGFARLVAEVTDTVKASDVLDLPDSTDRHVSIELAPPVRQAYDELEKHGIAQVEEGTLTAANAMVELLRLAQASSGFGRDVDTDREIPLNPGQRPDKAAALADLLEDLPAREPVVVFARFRSNLDAIEEVATSLGRRYGELSGRRRDGLTAESRMAPDVDVIGVQLQSGGVGIDLTRARVAVYYTLDFALADYKQSRARLVRPGQTRPVLFLHLVARNTVDHAVYGALRKREEVIDAVIASLQNGGSRG